MRNAEGNSNVLTISAQRGLVSQRHYFNKHVASENLSHYYLLERGDFAYNKSYSDGYPVGAIKRLDKYDKGVVSPLYICFRVDSRGPAASDYLVHFFESGMLDREVRAIAKEGARNHGLLNVKPSEFLALPIPLPSLDEQRKIAAILSSVDEAIEATQAVIDQLQIVKKAMMAELLIRGLPGSHTRFKQTEIGEVPEAWEVVELGDITSDSAFGPRFPSADYNASGNFGTLRTTDVNDDWEIDYATIPKASLDPALFSGHVLRDGDLLVTRSGTCGVVTVFERQATEIIPGAFLIRFRLRDGIDPNFVRLAMMEGRAQARVQAMAAGGVQKNLSGTNLARLLLPKPSPSEQAQIVEVIATVDSRRRSERSALRGLRAVKSALMTALLTGEVRVAPDEAAA